jgi:phenylpyruvate tautomerase PptA (4-oxalocrotonate tautomerase family)
MPSTRVETRKGWLGTRRADFLEAIQQSLVEGLLIPDRDRDIRLTEYDAEDVLLRPGAGERRTNIEIALFSGRSIEAKRRLYQALVTRLAPFGLVASDIKVILIEVDRQDWGLNGVPASEMELDFKVDV